MLIKILPLEYIVCELAAKDMWCSKKGGMWGVGLINSKADPYKAERVGRLGEMAVAKYLGMGVDFAYRHGGDSQDILLNGKKLDIKTAAKKPEYMAGLIRIESAKGRLLELKADIYGFCYAVKDNGLRKEATINLVGFIKKEDLLKREHVDAKVGKHKNLEIPYRDLTLRKSVFK